MKLTGYSWTENKWSGNSGTDERNGMLISDREKDWF